MKPRQLLQALRRVRHRSIAAVSTTFASPQLPQILLLLTLCSNEQGCLSVSGPFGCLYLCDYGRLTSSALAYPVEGAATCQGAMTVVVKHWLD
jgi:hypothetical protein